MSSKKKRKHRPVAGAVPGSAPPPPNSVKSTFTLIEYSPQSFSSTEVTSPESLPALDPGQVHWLNIEGYQDNQFIEAIVKRFGFHGLILEDVYYSKISRVDEFPKCLSVGFPIIDRSTGELTMTSLLLGENFVLTFQKSDQRHILDPIITRIRESMGNIRNLGSDYLAYTVLDSGVDTFFPVLDRWSEELDSWEQDMAPDTGVDRVREIRKELSIIGRATRGLRDAVGSIVRKDPGFIATSNLPYFRDCLSHIREIVEEVERLRDLTSEHLNSYDSLLRERNNEAVQTLTIVSTLFIPLSFIAGLYGMNFDSQASPFNMPELRWTYGYPTVIAIMALITVGFLVYFKRKRWI